MKRFLCLLFLCALLPAALTGCLDELSELPGISQMPSTPEPPATPAPEVPGFREGPTAYYNAYLGLEVAVHPQDIVNELNDFNLGSTPGHCPTFDDMDWEDLGGSYQTTLLAIANASDASDEGHASMWLFAEYYPGWTYEEYLDDFGSWLDMDNGESVYTLEDVDAVTLGGWEYTRFLARVESYDGFDAYYEEYYVTPVDECYFVAEIDYWEDSPTSYRNASVYLERFSLSGSGGPPATAGGGTFRI